MNFSNITNPKHIKIAALLVEKAQELDYDLYSDYTEVGYNENSGYVWLWNEMEQLTLGLEDFAYNPTKGAEQVELLFTCPATGEEFFAYSRGGVRDQYLAFVTEALEDGDIVPTDVQEAIYCGGVCYEVMSEDEAAEIAGVE